MFHCGRQTINRITKLPKAVITGRELESNGQGVDR